MFTAELVVSVPYFANTQGRPQVIQMPVGPVGMIDMVIYAGFQTARAEGTADINVKSRFKKKGAEFADVD